MPHVAPYKKEIVKKLKRWISEYPIIAVVDVENLPAKQYQEMREKLRDKVLMFMTKKRLMKIAFEQSEKSKKGITNLKDHFKGMPLLIFTRENPFKLFSILKKNKSSAPAKAGQIAPKDIIVPAGPTSFAPGPVIGELGALGIKTKVDGGKIAVLNDTKVASEGDEISENLAAMLTRMQIFPMEVGLAITAIYEDGIIYTKSVLDVDEDQFKADVYSAAGDAFNLAVELGYSTPETTSVMIAKAHRESMELARTAVIFTSETVGSLLNLAIGQMNAIQNKVN